MAATSIRYYNLLTERNVSYILGKLELALKPARDVYYRVKDDLDVLLKIVLLHYRKGITDSRMKRTFVKASSLMPNCYGYFTLKMKVWVEHLILSFFSERNILLSTEVISKLSTLFIRLLAICFKFNKIKGIC